MSKISQLTTATTLASDDLLEVVDVSDPSMSVTSGTNKKITASTLANQLSSIGNYAASSHTHNTATDTAAGFMSSADKSKLDNIASNITPNFTSQSTTDSILNLTKGDYIFNEAPQDVFVLHEGTRVFGDGSKKLKTTTDRSDNHNYFLASFFSATDFLNRPLGIHSSSDGIHFTKLTDVSSVSNQAWNFGDPSLLIKNGNYYVAFTYEETNTADFGIAVSSNLVEWKVHKVKFGSNGIRNSNSSAPGWSYIFPNGPNIWAPEWFEDSNGKLYLTISIRTQADQDTVEIQNEWYFRQYISECINLQTLSFSIPEEMRINNKKGPSQCLPQDNVIDASIVKKDGIYYMALKDEYNKEIDTFYSSNLTGNWTLLKKNIFQNLSLAGTTEYTEAPSICPIYKNNSISWLLYCDKYVDKNIYVTETTNFIDFTQPISIENDSICRHGTVVNLGSLHAHERDKAIKDAQLARTFGVVKAQHDVKAFKNLKDVPEFPNITNFVPENGTLYRLLPDTNTKRVSIIKIDTSAPDGDYFFLAVYFENYYVNSEPVRVVLENVCIGIVPNNRKYVIGQHTGNADQIYKFIKVEGVWRIESSNDTRGSFGRNNDYVNFTNVSNYLNINQSGLNWWPIVGYTYVSYYNVTDYPTTVNIHNIPTLDYPDGSYFYLLPRTDHSDIGSITLKTNSNSLWSTDTKFSGNEFDARLIEIRMIGNKWAIVR